MLSNLHPTEEPRKTLLPVGGQQADTFLILSDHRVVRGARCPILHVSTP